MHFGERHSQLLLFCEYVFAPGKSPVDMQPDILEIFLLRKAYAGECHMDRLGFVSFYLPSL
jgi:hypothetical protein